MSRREIAALEAFEKFFERYCKHYGISPDGQWAEEIEPVAAAAFVAGAKFAEPSDPSTVLCSLNMAGNIHEAVAQLNDLKMGQNVIALEYVGSGSTIAVLRVTRVERDRLKGKNPATSDKEQR